MFGKKDVTKEDVLKVLGTVQEPELHRDLVSLGMVEDLQVEGSSVGFTVVLTTPACPLKSEIERQAREAVMAIPGVKEVQVKLTSRVRTAQREKAMIPGVRNVIAVGSGKGGVGKSTVSVGLALALAESGAKVGLLDADVWGPNIPQMLGVQTPPQQDGDKILPALSHEVKMISMGFFVDESTPVIWRGPMVGKMVEQLLTDVDWGELDYLVVDLPPGTGDASLTLAQAIPLSGLVVVVTPQDVAVADALKAVSMFERLNIPILGIVENMSYFLCPHCNERTDIFGQGGARRIAEKHDVPLLGELPLDPAVRAGGDTGQPILVVAPQSPVSEAFRKMAGRVAARVSVLGSVRGSESAEATARRG
ncbi:MAG: iron-sulfur cluster carrier protein ApbC [Chloroflexi bacterium]|nr:iron-sulfur cluster carrier protein ApbC [Chloroflexota bacterium]